MIIITVDDIDIEGTRFCSEISPTRTDQTNCFKYHDCVKRVIFQARDIAKRLTNVVLVIL